MKNQLENIYKRLYYFTNEATLSYQDKEIAISITRSLNQIIKSGELEKVLHDEFMRGFEAGQQSIVQPMNAINALLNPAK